MSGRVRELRNFDTGTAGLSSAMQLESSTSTCSLVPGTASMPQIIFPTEKKEINRREETRRETIRRVINRHRGTLDRLAQL